MRFCLLAVGLLAATLLANAYESENSNAEAAIKRVLETQQDAWNRGDVNAFLEGYWHSSDLTFSGTNGTARGFDAVRVRYQNNYPDRVAMGKLDFSALEIRLLGPDAALVLGHWHLTRAQGDIGGVFSLVLQRFPNQGWRIIHDHTSVVNEPVAR
jgi:uncharacterized protein (TIGR02246 family)